MLHRSNQLLSAALETMAFDSHGSMRNIVVALDESEQSLQALKW